MDAVKLLTFVSVLPWVVICVAGCSSKNEAEIRELEAVVEKSWIEYDKLTEMMDAEERRMRERVDRGDMLVGDFDRFVAKNLKTRRDIVESIKKGEDRLKELRKK